MSTQTQNKFDFSDQATKDWLIGLLKETDIEVIFTKVDGTDRVMNCTLNEKYLPGLNMEQGDPPIKKRLENDGVLRVWDMDKDSWRSFKWDSIKSISFEV